MNTYVVRIYRYEKDNPGMLAGIVENPEDGERKPFKNIEELWGFLNMKCSNKGGSLYFCGENFTRCEIYKILSGETKC